MCFWTFVDHGVVLWRLCAQGVLENHLQSLCQRCWPFGRCSGHILGVADAIFGFPSKLPSSNAFAGNRHEHAKLSLARRSLSKIQLHTAATLLSLLRAPRSQRHHLQHLGHRPRHLARPPGGLCKAKLPAFPEWRQRQGLHATSRVQSFLLATTTLLPDNAATITFTPTTRKKVSTPVLSVLRTTQESITRLWSYCRLTQQRAIAP